MHSKAVAATSQVFDRLVNGGMSESQTRSAQLRDVDPETFIRFLEYAYRHDYTDPLWIWQQDASSTRNETKGSDGFDMQSPNQKPTVPDEDPIQQATVAGAGFDFGGTWTNSRSAPSGFGAVPSFSVSPAINTIKKNKRVRNAQTVSRAAFEKREYVCPSYSVPTPPRDLDLTSPSRTFAPIFLAHARLYTLADMYMVYPLRDFALHRLHKALISFQLHPGRLGDVVELARYAYEHGEDRSEDGKIDAMRELVVSYVACETKVLGKHGEFRNLMEGGGELPGDFWDAVQDLS